MVKLAVAGALALFVAGAVSLPADEAYAGGRCGPGKGGGWFGKKGNNGFGNGGFDGVPGRSADNNAPNAGQKRADQVR